MPGRKRFCCSGVPNAMITGATITGPNGMTRGAPASAVSSSNRCFWIAFQPGPPNSFGQAQPCQPCLPRILAQRCRSSRVRWIEFLTLSLMSLGRLSRTQARICSRNACSSGVKARSIGVSGSAANALFSTIVRFAASAPRQRAALAQLERQLVVVAPHLEAAEEAVAEQDRAHLPGNDVRLDVVDDDVADAHRGEIGPVRGDDAVGGAHVAALPVLVVEADPVRVVLADADVGRAGVDEEANRLAVDVAAAEEVAAALGAEDDLP